MGGWAVLTEDLASSAPGSGECLLPEGIDLASVPDDQIIAVLQSSWRQVSQANARYLAALAELGCRTPSSESSTYAADRFDEPDSRYWCTSQIEVALTFTARRADSEYEFALLLLRKLPQVWVALRAGEIDLPKARVFTTYLGELTERQIAAVCARVLPKAPGWTTGQLAHRLAREVLAIDPGFTRRRYQKAVRERGVWGYLAADGTAVLSGHGLPPSEAAAAAERLEDLASAVRAAGHPHTEAQLRADLFLRLLDGRFNGFTRDQIIAAMLVDAAEASTGSARSDDFTEANVGADSQVVDLDDAIAPVPEEVVDLDDAAVTDSAADLGDATVRDATTDPPPAVEPPVVANDGVEADGGGEAAVGPQPQNRASGSGPAPTDPVRYGVEVRIGLGTLLGLDEHPAELPGWGPIDAADARMLVARQHAAEWRFAVLDEPGYLVLGGLVRRRPTGTGSGERCRGGVVEIHIRSALLADLARDIILLPGWAPVVADIARQFAARHAALRRLDDDPRSRYPSAGLRRHIQLRDRTCVAPGCRRPARKADQDHTRDHASGGATVRANLEPLCTRHHLMKHRGGWRLAQPRPGRFRWCSPLRQIYWTRGEPIAVDLPEPVPRDDDRGDDCCDDGDRDGNDANCADERGEGCGKGCGDDCGERAKTKPPGRPIFSPTGRTSGSKPERRPPHHPPTPGADDEPPPF